MEDLWKDITLSTLSSIHHPSPAQPRHQHHRHHLRSSGSSLTCTTIFQDFLARPFSLDHHHHHHTTNILPSPSPSPTPQTLLSLNTDQPPHFHQHSPHHHHSSFDIINNTSASSSSVHHFGKRLLQQETESHEMTLGSQCPSGRRHKRMIKNRESAARSRARKQAYTSELELEVAQLKQENARLRMEQEMLNQTATVDESPKKHKKLHRTSTAPF